jgi:retron-type reverse transcriptase
MFPSLGLIWRIIFFSLHDDLKNNRYQCGSYQQFYISDPKLRSIHKATVRDRVLHQAIFRVLYPVFDSHFIHDSYSCRDKKGTHLAVWRLGRFLQKSSHNHTSLVWTLKCDIKKFFDSIDHQILIDLLTCQIKDSKILNLLCQIIWTFEAGPGRGLPLGNVTSQLFANIYLNELDQFAKHHLKIAHYLRYCDDFIIVHPNKDYLLDLIKPLGQFLSQKLKLNLHPSKIIVRKITQGIDYLGYVTFPHYRILRPKTKRRILRRVTTQGLKTSSFCSYCGMLRHCFGLKILMTLTGLNNKYILEKVGQRVFSGQK